MSQFLRKYLLVFASLFLISSAAWAQGSYISLKVGNGQFAQMLDQYQGYNIQKKAQGVYQISCSFVGKINRFNLTAMSEKLGVNIGKASAYVARAKERCNLPPLT